MQNHVAPADGARSGLGGAEIRLGLVHGKACDDRARAGRTGPKGEDFDRFWHRFERLFYRDSYTGNRFFDENCARFLKGQNRRYRRNGAKLCSARGRFWIDFGIVLNVYFDVIRHG